MIKINRKSILKTKVNEMHYFSNLFVKELYMFRTDLLPIISSRNTVFTAIGICHTSNVDCLLARSGWNILTSLADSREIVHLSNRYCRLHSAVSV